MLHRNGTPPTPVLEKALPPVPPRTEFLPDLPIDTPRALIYHLSRQQVAGLPVLRWLYLLIGACTLLTLFLPTPWLWLGVLSPLSITALWLWEWSARRRNYIHFTPLPPPPVVPVALSPSVKLPVYVSGLLAVENKARPFAGVPGFYRTFGTREHALLCQARRRSLLKLASWPAEEEGLWYAFFTAAHVHGLQTGVIAFDRRSLPGFALDYTPAQPLGSKRRRKPQRLTLYVAFPRQEDFQAALGDLAVEPITISSASATS